MTGSEKALAVQRRKRLRSSQRGEGGEEPSARRARRVSHHPERSGASDSTSFGKLLEAAMNGQGPSEEFMSQSLERHKIWKRSGAPYDAFCFACNKSEGISPCVTCRRQYHESCRSNDSITVHDGSAKGWYCEICVVRKWHINPPTLTPPTSPPPEILSLVGEETGQDASTIALPPQPERARLSSGPQAPLPDKSLIQCTSASQPSARNHSSHPPASEVFITHPNTESRQMGPVDVPTLPSRSSETSTYINNRPAIPRRSRYTTLPMEVDSALRVLYSELETAAELRQQISGLEGQVVQLRQDLSLRDRELQMAQKALDLARASQSELVKLRSEAAQRQGSVQEAATLRAEKQQLEVELKSSQAQVEEMARNLQEWKQKLSALIS